MDNILHIPFALGLTFSFILGLVFGSFGTAVAYRMPRDINWVIGKSRCPSCNHDLGILDLFPVLSWLTLRGKCRYCKTSFGWTYPMIELCTALLCTLCFVLHGISWLTLVLMLLCLTLVVMSIIDFEHYIIPDELNFFMLLLGGVYCVIIGTSIEFLILGPILGFALGLLLRWIMYVWKGREGLGLGDVKFLAVVGLFLPLQNFPAFLFLSGVLGVLIALVWRVKGKGEQFPFGPALGMAMLVCVLFPHIGSMWQGVVIKILAPVIGSI